MRNKFALSGLICLAMRTRGVYYCGNGNCCVSTANPMRHYIRHPANVPIEVVATDQVNPEQPGLNDISRGGLAFTTPIPHAKGEILTIRLPSIQPSVAVTGRVAWCHFDGEHYHTGIQFDNPDDAFSVRMYEQVCHIESYRRELSKQLGREVGGEEAASEWISRYAADFPGFRGEPM